MLILIELGLHFLRPIEYFRPPGKLPNNVWRELLHRPSSVPELAYELVPNVEGFARGVTIQTNSFGMRDSEPRPKADVVNRIVVLGDSFTFGYGVRGDDAYPNVLEKLLNESHGDKQFEVLNLGVSGYTTEDEALVLRYKGLNWNPSLVIIGYVLNDPEIDPRQPLHRYYQKSNLWQYSNILRLIAKAKNGWDVIRLGEGDYYRYLHSPQQQKWRSVVQAFDDIDNMTQGRNIPVLLLIFPVATTEPWSKYAYKDLHVQVAHTAKRRGFYVIDLYDSFSQHPPMDLMISSSDGHPSKFGHALAANVICEWLSRNSQQINLRISQQSQ